MSGQDLIPKSDKAWNAIEKKEGNTAGTFAWVKLGKADESWFAIGTEFGFNITPQSTGPIVIEGVQVNPYSKAEQDGFIVTQSLMLTKNGGHYPSWSNNRGDDNGLNKWDISEDIHHFGGNENDLWGYSSLTADHINSDNFGVVFACENFLHSGSVPTVQADVHRISITVWYTDDGGPTQNTTEWIGKAVQQEP